MLLGRAKEQAAVDRLVEHTRSGSGGALLLLGEAGIGKSSLLQRAAEDLDDFQVLRVGGVQSEVQLAFAALHTLLRPLLGRQAGLPRRQRDALGAAFGLATRGQDDQFLVGLAVLTLVTEAAARTPVLCIVDDAQWIDQESIEAICFVARRLDVDRVAMLFAITTPSDRSALLHGLTSLDLEGLDAADSRELLGLSVAGPVDPRVAVELLDQTRGNPLAMVELGNELSASELAGVVSFPTHLPVSERLEASFLRQARTLSTACQTLLLVAAAEPGDDAAIVRAACTELELPAGTEGAVEASGLLKMSPTVEFRHPLVRSAIYSGASRTSRQDAHAALAQVTDSVLDPDRRAWHLASAVIGHDDDIADQLELSAGRSRLRGGFVVEAAGLVRSAELTSDPQLRSARLMRACDASLSAGDTQQAERLLALARPHLRDPLLRATADRLAGLMCFPLGHTAEAAAVLLGASRALYPLDADLAVETLLGAFEAYVLSLDMTEGTTAAELAGLAVEWIDASRSESPAAPTGTPILLEAAAGLIGRGCVASVPEMRLAAAAALDGAVSPEHLVNYMTLWLSMANELWDDSTYASGLQRIEQVAREQGALGSLPIVLCGLASFETRAGRFSDARARYSELLDVAEALGPYRKMFENNDVALRAWKGEEESTRSAAAEIEMTVKAVGVRTAHYDAELALAELELGLGDFERAFRIVRQVVIDEVPGWACQALPHLVETATRCGETGVATEALRSLSERATATATPWALGLLHRCDALVNENETRADESFRSAIEQMDRTLWVTEQARTRLMYGEWLRSKGDQVQARDQLRRAHEMFARMGAAAYAERARVELLASGERARGTRISTLDELTPQQTRIARLAGDRITSREIAAQLFISSNTVDFHLKKVFKLLHVNSRSDLAAVLAEIDGADPTTPGDRD